MRDTPAAFAWRPVGLVGLGLLVLLVALAGRYGYHRDELCFSAAGATSTADTSTSRR